MTLDDIDVNQSTHSAGQYTTFDSSSRLVRALHRVEPSTHTPSDSAWVSPFTLPPLTKPQSGRGQSTLVTSPVRHQRSSSSAYYAAVWGSPYATPSPHHSPPVSRRSLNSQSWSPVAVGSVERVGIAASSSRRPPTARAAKSERPNWLSDSEDSSVGSTDTPTRATERLDAVTGSARSGHQIHERAATVTQENFRGLWHQTMNGSPRKEKPLPGIPMRTSISEMQGSFAASSLTSATRPKTLSNDSFQRLRKKVIWRGKTCIISLPTDETGRFEESPLLTPADVQERMRGWEREGYDTRGFILTNSPHDGLNRGSQSRTLHPDPSEMKRERQDRIFNVNIPNQAEWEFWVEYLKEEKLRALGVTSSNSEAPASTRSPLSTSLSRNSSQYPSVPMSPENGAMSATSGPLRLGSNPYAASYIRYPGAHSYKQSLAQPPMQARVTSPFDYLGAQVPFSNRGGRSPPGYFNQRQMSISPAGMGGVQSLSEVLSPVSPFTSDTPAPSSNSNAIVEQMRRQQEFQALQARQQQQQQLVQSLSQQTGLPMTPSANANSRPSLEIAHPTPRSHRHNLSEALQKEIDEAQRALEEHDRQEQELEEAVNASTEGKQDELSEAMLNELPSAATPNLSTQADEIETNPSIAASPALVETKNGLADWQWKDETAQPTGAKGHRVKPSFSKLNVEAKPFNPQGTFSGASFMFGSNAFGSVGTGLTTAIPVFGSNAGQRMTKSVIAPHLNVAAPAFTPSALAQPAQATGKFNFSSATFNVEAPEFNPTRSVGAGQSSGVLPSSGDETASGPRIFGDVVIDPSSKAVRRGSKAVAIVTPVSKDDPEVDSDREEEVLEEDGDDGRIRAPIDRQKRARRAGSDGDGSPVFAASAPFLQKQPSEPVEDDMMSETDKLVTPAEAQPMPVAELLEKQPDASASLQESSPSTLKYENETSRSAEAGPTSSPHSALHEDVLDKAAEDDCHASIEEDYGISTDVSERVSGHRSSLSALAKPFDFAPSGPISALSHQREDPTPAPARKSLGLEASRFAVAPSSSISSASNGDKTMNQTVEENVAFRDDHSAASEEEDHETFDRLRRQELEDEADNEELRRHLEEADRTMPITETDDEPVPSYEEIDAVMKQFEDNPELGVERIDSPPMRSTPLTGMQLPPNLRSDAPSPSPRRAEPTKDELLGSECHWRPPKQSLEDITIHKLTTGNEPVSDWGDTLSPLQADKLESRAQFFDGRVSDLVDGILENRLGPLEETLKTIQNSLALLATRPKSTSGRRSMSTDLRDSDADDEDDYDAFEGWAAYRSRSPTAKRDRKPEMIRAAVLDALATHQSAAQETTQTELNYIRADLAEMRQAVQRQTPQSDPEALKTVVEDVIANHPKLRGHRAQQSHGGGDDKRILQVNGLETMLKVTEERAAIEVKARRDAEDELADALRRLRHAEEEAAQHRESSEAAERSLSAIVKEREAYQDLEQEASELKWKIAALETTLEEYRASSDQWREDIKEERGITKDLRRSLDDAREQLEERSQSRHALRVKVERLQEEMATIVQEVASDQAQWRQREHSLVQENKTTQAALEDEIRHREKIELELDDLDRERKENIKHRTASALAEQEVSRLQMFVHTLREENRALQDKNFQLERELGHIKDNGEAEISKATTALQAALGQSRAETSSLRSDFEAQVARLQNRLDNAELDLEEQKAKHETQLAEALEDHNQALQEASEKAESALQEQHASHEKKLADLRERHTRALHNSSDDRHRLEHHLNEKLSLSEDKATHLETKVADLEERLEITKSAARAAVEAATAKGINLPTPAQSTISSPPHPPAPSASLLFGRGSDLPEKISPQALRESILVLQDQLQNREQTIEKLEAELGEIDKEAPAKIKDRETEIGWLRELLSVRIEDIEDIISTLTKPDFDREAAKDAAIRLKANLQMEQQLKERTATGMTISLPTMSSLSTLTQSPRALPMAAAAAWGNWRKSSSFGALSDLATNLSQTPSRSTVGSPASFLSGMMTPPNTMTRTGLAADPVMAPPSMRSLGNGARKSSTEARPLRAYNSQPRALSLRQQDKQPASRQQPQSQIHPQPPSTPPLMGHASYDGDADVKSLTSDLDADASPLGGKENARSFET